MAQAIPWQAKARAIVQRLGVEPRNFRRVRWLHKARVVRACDAALWRNARFILIDPEPHNFTYEIGNDSELAAWVAEVSGCDPDTALALLREPDHDEVLSRRLRAATRGHWLWAKSEPPLGKRLGWYALVRALRPRLIIETGVHDGLGTLVLLRALERNGEDGARGRLVSFDVNPAAGWLVGEDPSWEFRREASQQGLPGVLSRGQPVDMFIYDGWHSYEHERDELQLVAPHLSPAGVLLSDDAQVTSALADVCVARELSFSAVFVRPQRHFHPGTALGAGRRAGAPAGPGRPGL